MGSKLELKITEGIGADVSHPLNRNVVLFASSKSLSS